MMTSYKAGVLRPELIRLKDALSVGLTFVQQEVAPRKKRWWESSQPDDTDPVVVGLMSKVVEKRLEAMIEMCDHAVEHQHVLYLDESDLMFINQLRVLQEAIKHE